MSNFKFIFKKELTDFLRDKKTLIFTILLPILVFPAIFKVMSITMENTTTEATKEINIAIDGSKNTGLLPVLEQQGNIFIKDFDEPYQALKNGDLQLILKIPEDFDKKIAMGENPTMEILIDDESQKSTIASSIVQQISTAYSQELVKQKLSAQGIDPSILEPYKVEVKSGLSKDGSTNEFSTMILSMLPSLIIIFMISPTISMAADLGAGEKERNTFEPLLSTSVSRNAILFGKLASIFVVALVALILSVSSYVFSMKNFMGSGAEFNISLTPQSIALMIGFALLVLVAVCAIEMALSIYARSEKEAGTYLSGIIMPVFILGYLPMMMDAKSISFVMFNVPITNVVCVMKEFLVGIFDIQHILVTAGWNIVYIILAILFVRYMFSREEVIFRA
ncbi:MAG: ABC transporter permease [Clostridium sp.]